MARGGSTLRFKRSKHGAESTMEVKLVINRASNQVLYVEAGLEFVDFLFGLVSLPLSSILSVCSGASMAGSVVKLYESIENMEATFFAGSRWVRDDLLCADLPSTFSDLAGDRRGCRRRGNRWAGRESRDRCGIVYMITNELQVMTMSTAAIIALMKSSSVNMENVEERMVTVGLKEKIGILTAVLSSKNVFTDVFLSAEVRRSMRRSVSHDPSTPRKRGRGGRISSRSPGTTRNKRSATSVRGNSSFRRWRGVRRAAAPLSGRIGSGRGGGERRSSSSLPDGGLRSRRNSSEGSDDDEAMVESEVKVEINEEDEFSYSLPKRAVTANPQMAANSAAPPDVIQSPPPPPVASTNNAT